MLPSLPAMLNELLVFLTVWWGEYGNGTVISMQIHTSLLFQGESTELISYTVTLNLHSVIKGNPEQHSMDTHRNYRL
jgi:hypothetical protein